MGKLTDRTVKAALPGRHGDDAVRGLMLVVQPGGSRSWMLRYQLNGRRRDMGLGPYPEITLARAREKAMDARRLVKEGCDPLADRARVPALTFKAAAEALIESKRPGWRNAKHAAQWTSTLETYACPVLGRLDASADCGSSGGRSAGEPEPAPGILGGDGGERRAEGLLQGLPRAR